MHPENLVARLSSVAHSVRPNTNSFKSVKSLIFPFGDNHPMASSLYVCELEFLSDATVHILSAKISPVTGDKTLHLIFFESEVGTAVYFVQNDALDLSAPHKADFSLSEFKHFQIENKAAGHWNILRTPTIGWVLPDAGGAPFGKWSNYRLDDNSLFRVLNIDALNKSKTPVIGAFSMLYFERTAQESKVVQWIKKHSFETTELASDVDVITQRDIFSLFDDYGVAPDKLAPALIEGVKPTTSAYPASWSHTTHVDGWAIGLDFFPYKMEAQYWWSEYRQRAAYTGLGEDFGNNRYTNRMESHLYSSETINSYLSFSGGNWEFDEIGSRLPIGLPKPDYIMAAGGKSVAVVEGNPHFCHSFTDSLRIFKVTLPRSADITSFFWLIFDQKSRGLVFMECEYADQPQHALQLVDYESFRRAAFSEFSLSDFSDPSMAVCSNTGDFPQNENKYLSTCMLTLPK